MARRGAEQVHLVGASNAGVVMTGSWGHASYDGLDGAAPQNWKQDALPPPVAEILRLFLA
jgi:hypothetical protein